MKTKSKLVFLELITSLFGWIWIGASIIALYSLIVALFSDGTWSQFFWALGASIIAKWLTRGFEDNRERIAYEAKLVNEGYSVEEAGQIWFQQYSKTSESGNQSNDLMAIIQAYGKAIETSAPSPSCVADENKLPYPKNKIKKAIIAGLRSTEDPQIKEHLKISYIQLADWQKDVGELDQGFNLTNIDINQDTESLAKAVLKQPSSSRNWATITQKEQEILKQELQDLGLW
ncbi:NfeD family protein [Ghiorsea bivora]|uniref:NfeD family protein n=1 Tax=Ghiorsea bivora TaxID=1485545 RepID=UPI00057114F8|nr:hypothetical protein [Ghiorsea bivora]